MPRPRLHALLVSSLLAMTLGCAAPEPVPSEAAERSPAPSPSASPPSPREVGKADESEELPLVIFLGDSLSAGYGLPEDEAFPALIEESLAEEGLPIRLVNAGVSGDTTAGGLARLDWLLGQEPDVLVVELGANDGLRALPLEQTEANLREIVGRAREAGARVLLLGMRVPPNYGEAYALGFDAIFPRLAEELEVATVPFFLDGVAGRPELNLPDGIHPTAEGHEILARNVLPALRPLAEEARRQKPGP